MAYTQEQIHTLEQAIAEGALSVKYGDKQVTYRSLAEMIRTLEMMKESLGQRRPRRVYGEVTKGL
jgi:hypothetical protein